MLRVLLLARFKQFMSQRLLDPFLWFKSCFGLRVCHPFVAIFRAQEVLGCRGDLVLKLQVCTVFVVGIWVYSLVGELGEVV